MRTALLLPAILLVGLISACGSNHRVDIFPRPKGSNLGSYSITLRTEYAAICEPVFRACGIIVEVNGSVTNCSIAWEAPFKECSMFVNEMETKSMNIYYNASVKDSTLVPVPPEKRMCEADRFHYKDYSAPVISIWAIRKGDGQSSGMTVIKLPAPMKCTEIRMEYDRRSFTIIQG